MNHCFDCGPLAYRGAGRRFKVSFSACLLATWFGGAVADVYGKSVAYAGAELGSQGGWQYTDRSNGGEGDVRTSSSGVLLRDAEGVPSPGATLEKKIDFDPSGNFYLVTIALEFESIGLADDSSGSRSSAMLYFSFGDVGFDLRIYGDRIVFDPAMRQYQVVRFGEGKQELTFLVDLHEKRARVSRNGAPLGLYRTSNLPDSFVRITAIGSEDLPCEIRVESLEVADAQWDNPPHTDESIFQPRSVHAAEWPTYYRDKSQTCRSPLRGTKSELAVVSSAPLGGDAVDDVWAHDIDGDGRQELIVANGGTIQAVDLAGQRRWQASAAGSILGMFDLDGDGTVELVLNPLTAINLASGKVQISAVDPDSGAAPAMGPWKIADLQPSNPGLEAVFLRGARGYVYQFRKGETKAVLHRQFDITEVAQGFTPTLAVADMDSSGAKEIVFVTYDRAYALDASDGQPRMMHYWNAGRNYADVAVANIDADPYPEVVIHATTLREHLAVLDNDGLNLDLRYDKFYEQNYPDNAKDYAACLDSVNDFDGDGAIEILQSLYNDQGDGRWHTLVLDALSGRVELDLEDCRAEGVVARGAGQPPWILLAMAHGREHFSGLSAYTPAVGRLTVSEQGSLVKEGTARNLPPDQGVNPNRGVPLLRPLAASPHEAGMCLVQEGSQLVLITLPTTGEGAVNRQRIAGLTLVDGDRIWLASDLDGDGYVDLVVSRPATGRLHALSGIDGREMTSLPIHGVRRTAIAVRLRPEDPELTVLAVNWQNHLLAWRDFKTQPTLKWTLPVQPRSGVFDEGSSVTAHDFDNDGAREILAGLPGDKVALIDPDGAVVRSWQVDNPVHDWAIGNFNGNASSDLAVTTSGSVTQYRTFMFDSSTESPPIWDVDLGPYWGGPAAYDTNRDGIDDYICRYFFMRHVLDGRNGLDLQTVPWRQGYHAVAIVYPWEDCAKPAFLFHGGMYTQRLEKPDGALVWEHLVQSGNRHGAVGDFDGDGKLESACQSSGVPLDLATLKPLEGSFPPTVYLWDLATGRELAKLEMESSIQEGLIAVDLDGDGRDEIVAGTDSGRLVVLGIEQKKLQIESSLSMPAGVGRPTAVDIDLDDQPEILVGCDNGLLYLLQCAP